MWARFSAPVKTGPGAHPASCTMGTGSFPGVKSGGGGVTLTPHSLLVLWSSKSRAVPLLPLSAVRPVQSLSACTRVHFTFYWNFSAPCLSLISCWDCRLESSRGQGCLSLWAGLITLQEESYSICLCLTVIVKPR
jgi:hypothetical protein